MKTVKPYNVFLLISLFLALFIKGGDIECFAGGNSFPAAMMEQLSIEDDNSNEPATSIKINFGHILSSDSKWNNLSRSNGPVSLNDANGESTGISIRIDKIFSGDNTEGVENTDTQLQMPEDVSKSALWGYTKGSFGSDPPTKSSDIVFSHLNKNQVYDFYIFGSRKNVNDNRETKYATKGENLKSRHLDTANNSDGIALIKGIKPSLDGEITLTVSAGENNTNDNQFYYLNALQIVAREYQDGDFDDNEEEEEIPDNAIKILAIGNSFSEDAVEQNLYDLAIEAGIELIIGNAYRGGQGLDSHWNVVTNNKADFEYRKVVDGYKTNTYGKTLLDCLLDEKWDYITFQQVSQDSGLPSSYEPWLGYLLDYVKEHTRNPDVKFAIHRTWAYEKTSDHGGFNNYGRNQKTMYESIVNAVNSVIKKYEGIIDMVIPAGTAIQNVRSSFIGDALCRDGYHLNDLGRYTAACTWLEMITGESAVDKSYFPSSIGEIEAKIAQYAAHYAVMTPDEVTSMNDFGYMGDNTIEPATPIKINFGSISSDTQWNDITLSNRGKIGLEDMNGDNTEIIIRIDKIFGGDNTEGCEDTDTQLEMPADVARSAIWGYAKGTFGGNTLTTSSSVLLSHLNKDLVYDFYIFSSRKNVNDNREGRYVVQGYNLKSTHLDASNNKDEVALIRGIKPSPDGEIRLTVSAGENNTNENQFYYLNALQIVAREYEDGDFEDDEPEATLDIDGDKKYYIRNINTGYYLSMETDVKEGEEVGLRRSRLNANDTTPFEFTLIQVIEGKSIYNLSVGGKYLNGGEEGICILEDEIDENSGQIYIELQDEPETFKMRGFWKPSPNYMSFANNSLRTRMAAIGEVEEADSWKLEEIPTVGISAKNIAEVQVYPTYTTGEVSIITSAEAVIRIMDFSGRVLETHQSTGELTLHLNYEEGIYIIAVGGENGKAYKVVLCK